MWDPAKVMQHRVPAGRATFGYLMSRCFLQGWGKAAMAHMDGFGREHVERAVLRGPHPARRGRAAAWPDALRGDLAGLGRSGSIVAAFWWRWSATRGTCQRLHKKLAAQTRPRRAS